MQTELSVDPLLGGGGGGCCRPDDGMSRGGGGGCHSDSDIMKGVGWTDRLLSPCGGGSGEKKKGKEFFVPNASPKKFYKRIALF